MSNIVLHYLYRDGSNYKNFKSLIFDNPLKIDKATIDTLIRSKLIDGTWFYAGEWQLPDLHFGTWDNEFDHTFHEFECIEYTNEPSNTLLTLATFIQLVEKTNWL